MRQQSIALRYVTRDDVARLKSWLEDDEVAESWFGRYSYGNPAHLGYNPTEIADVEEAEWVAIFEDPTHHILSIYTEDGEHIGEFHVAIEEAWGDGQISILIGRKDMWHKGYGTADHEGRARSVLSEVGAVPSVGGRAGIQYVGEKDVRAAGLHA